MSDTIAVPIGPFKEHHQNCELLRNIFLEPIFTGEGKKYINNRLSDDDLDLARDYILKICDFVIEYDVEQTQKDTEDFVDKNTVELAEEFYARTKPYNHQNNFGSIIRVIRQYYQKHDFIIEYDGNRQTIRKFMVVAFDKDMELLYYYEDDNLDAAPLGAINISSITSIKRSD